MATLKYDRQRSTPIKCVLDKSEYGDIWRSAWTRVGFQSRHNEGETIVGLEKTEVERENAVTVGNERESGQFSQVVFVRE